MAGFPALGAGGVEGEVAIEGGGFGAEGAVGGGVGQGADGGEDLGVA